MSRSKTHLYLKRLLVVFAICLVFVLAFNEIAYLAQKDQYDRAPQTIQLVIPAGTSERIAAGEPVPSIPKEMVFMLGDTLQVKNEDVAAHQLGPVWVPPGGTSSLKMEKAEKFAYQCSFASTQYLGLDVRQPTTLGIRLAGLAFAAPTMTALVFLYSLLVYPVEKRVEVDVENNSAG
jgi:hypothetical protein